MQLLSFAFLTPPTAVCAHIYLVLPLLGVGRMTDGVHAYG